MSNFEAKPSNDVGCTYWLYLGDDNDPLFGECSAPAADGERCKRHPMPSEELIARLPAWFVEQMGRRQLLVTKRRDGWRYVSGIGWVLDGTTIVLDFDPLNCEGELRGGYVVEYGPRYFSGPSIDHYLTESMRWVEEHLPYYLNQTDDMYAKTVHQETV